MTVPAVARLRAAEQRLRDVAGGATPGPYGVMRARDFYRDGRTDGTEHIVYETREPFTTLRHIASHLTGNDARHFAAMSPPVALALADWLAAVAGWEDELLGTCPGIGRTNYPDAWGEMLAHAITVADAVLAGSES